MKRKLIFVICLVFFAICSIVFFTLLIDQNNQDKDVVYGATVSTEYIKYLNIDLEDFYTDLLDDLGIRNIRIPVYWAEIEAQDDEFDFSEVDYLMDEAAGRDAKVTLAIGVKVPRWPECFIPDWASQYKKLEFREEVYEMVTKVVDRYKDHSALSVWQVENEPFFPFGLCGKPDAEQLTEEINLVRALDPNHAIQRTTSGEQALWFLQTKDVDIIGASLYRTVWNEATGYFTFPIPSQFYRLQKSFASLFVDKVIISELQAEPWLAPGVDKEDISLMYSLFNSEDLKNNVNFAKKTNIEEVYFWGVEWWYFLKNNNEDRLWITGKEIINYGK